MFILHKVCVNMRKGFFSLHCFCFYRVFFLIWWTVRVFCLSILRDVQWKRIMWKTNIPNEDNKHNRTNKKPATTAALCSHTGHLNTCHKCIQVFWCDGSRSGGGFQSFDYLAPLSCLKSLFFLQFFSIWFLSLTFSFTQFSPSMVVFVCFVCRIVDFIVEIKQFFFVRAHISWNAFRIKIKIKQRDNDDDFLS